MGVYANAIDGDRRAGKAFTRNTYRDFQPELPLPASASNNGPSLLLPSNVNSYVCSNPGAVNFARTINGELDNLKWDKSSSLYDKTVAGSLA